MRPPPGCPVRSAGWTTENAGGYPIRTDDTYHEARQTNGNRVGIWRGLDDNGIWVSFDGAAPYQISAGAHTTVAPTIVAWSNGWAAFHTGEDHRIYWTTSTDTPTGPEQWGDWTPLAGNTTAQTVSVTQPGPGSHQLLLAYRGDNRPESDDQRLWWLWFDGLNWSAPRLMGDNARSPSAPTVAWQAATSNSPQRYYAVHQGVDNHIYAATLLAGSNTWSSWLSLGGNTHRSPQIAVDSRGEAVTSHVADNGMTWSAILYPTRGEGFAASDFQQDVNRWQTRVGVALVTYGAFVYLLLTGFDRQVYFKQIH